MEYHEKIADPALEAQARAIDKLLICKKCQGERLDESVSPFAQKMRQFIRDQVQQQVPSNDIIKKIVVQHGQSILLAPPQNQHSAVLWWFPWVGLAAVIAAFLYKFFKKKL